MCESKRLTSYLLEYADNHLRSVQMVAADLEKSMDHNLLLATLRKFGFGHKFFTSAKGLLKNQDSCAINDGKTAKVFLCLDKLDREIRYHSIRCDKQIEGFGKGVKSTSFDDGATHSFV